uniref:Uncharacterized protein n=1 Tax=Panagrolaimus sp. JU765 TaxID=591449 RepID=A0AC34RS59_9BILA
MWNQHRFPLLTPKITLIDDPTMSAKSWKLFKTQAKVTVEHLTSFNQTNYKQVFGLNLIVWSDPATTIAAIKNVTNCEPTAPIATTPVAATGSTTAYFINPCFGYIPFSFDVSQQVSATKFAELKDFLINQFLKKIFPPRIPPTYFSIFTNNVDSFRLQPDVDTIIGIVNRTTQESVSNSNIKLPLGNFVSKNVVGLGADDLMPVNTVVFTGSALSNSDLTVFSNYATNLTSNGNTLTIVLLESTIDQTNYRRFPNIKLVVWSDPFSTLSKIRENMQCRLIGI